MQAEAHAGLRRATGDGNRTGDGNSTGGGTGISTGTGILYHTHPLVVVRETQVALVVKPELALSNNNGVSSATKRFTVQS